MPCLMPVSDLSVAEDILDRLKRGRVITRSHIRSIGHIADKHGVHRTHREDYIHYLTRLVRAIKTGEK